ncbi:uncharacterized protein LOC123542295 isoform X2 [Mercenaria mercenaria]|uniref:uncharacterized protein LOC123542295 isoform X2 n=1 Tax=Mercenaria mercenaria TaxID=6596 RepID=UPI00234F9273|nr:uncharacterized protein LOC123542295 isoform X2 [Mercenaria mercenaria]
MDLVLECTSEDGSSENFIRNGATNSATSILDEDSKEVDGGNSYGTLSETFEKKYELEGLNVIFTANSEVGVDKSIVVTEFPKDKRRCIKNNGKIATESNLLEETVIKTENFDSNYGHTKHAKEVYDKMLNERNSVKDNISKEDEKERYRKENILDKSLAYRIDTDIYHRTGSIIETCNEPAVDNVVSESEVIKFETYENGGETNVENHVENNLMEFEETFLIKTEPEVNKEQFVQSKSEGTGKTFPYMFDTYTSDIES